MKKQKFRKKETSAVLAGILLALGSAGVQAQIDGITGTTFNLTAKVDNISTADGAGYLLWGFADDDGSNGGRAQYPAPTLIVNQGDTVTINMKNELTVAAGTTPNVSIVFPGQSGVSASCIDTNAAPGPDCHNGTLALEAVPNGDTVSYTFTATHAGTYMYHSGTNPGLQVDMGLTGALIVRPPTAGQAYGHPDTAFDYEELFFITEMDPEIHAEVEFYGPDRPQLQVLLDNYKPTYWFLNGRTAPDNFSASYVSWLPTQPYDMVALMHPGDKLLMRMVGAGRELHPFHHHGNHAKTIAIDGRMVESAPGMGPDLATEGFIISTTPGKTQDAIFEWTGEGLNWDIYGGTDVNRPHTCNGKAVGEAQDPGAPLFDPVTHEYCPDHGKPFPTVLPEKQDLAFGGFWSGSPYLGDAGSLPPGEGGLNPAGGYTFMWHSHTERELTNDDLYPGGMLTMLVVVPHYVAID